MNAVVDLVSDTPPPPVARARRQTPRNQARAGHAEKKRKSGVIDLVDSDSDDDGILKAARRLKRRKRPRQDSAVNFQQVNSICKPAPVDITEVMQLEGPPAEVVVTKPKSSTMLVLEIFPEADLKFVRDQLKARSPHPDAAKLLIAYMSEHSYPKQPPASDMREMGEGLVHVQSWKYDYLSTDSFTPTALYVHQASAQLLNDFPFLSQNGVKQIMSRYKNHYAVCHDRILDVLKGEKSKNRPAEDLEDSQYRRVTMTLHKRRPLTRTQISMLDKIANSKKTTLKSFRKSQRALISDATLSEEFRYVQSKFSEWTTRCSARKDREKNKQLAQQKGTGIDCACCFDSTAIEDMVACKDEGHLFCVDCIRAFAENKIFGSGSFGVDAETKKPVLELKCCHSDGCISGFHRTSLEKALPPKTLKKYDELQFNISLKLAEMDDMSSCPKCAYQAALPATEKIFRCPVAECGFESCRSCGEASHIPLRCDEVVKDREETKGRVTIEEAITEAKIRKCPKCARGTIKSEGCNKIACPCGASFCYVCRSVIKDYKHFCQKPHCTHKTCNGCPLYSKEEDDVKAMRSAGNQAAANVGDAAKTVDVDSIMKIP